MSTTDQVIRGRDIGGEHMEDVERNGFWMRVICVDNGGETVDRYSIVVDVEPPWGLGDNDVAETFTYHASPNPFEPQHGVGQHADGWAIADDDVLIDWTDLPDRVREAVWASASQHWMLPTPNGYVEFSYNFDAGRWVARFGGGA